MNYCSLYDDTRGIQKTRGENMPERNTTPRCATLAPYTPRAPHHVSTVRSSSTRLLFVILRSRNLLELQIAESQNGRHGAETVAACRGVESHGREGLFGQGYKQHRICIHRGEGGAEVLLLLLIVRIFVRWAALHHCFAP